MEKENGAPDISAVSARHNDVGHLAAIICVTIQDIAVPAGTPTALAGLILPKDSTHRYALPALWTPCRDALPFGATHPGIGGCGPLATPVRC